MNVISALALLVILFLSPSAGLSQGFPRRIISLGPHITEEIYMLGAGDRLIANTTYCRIPPEAAKKEKIGTVTGVNVEKIVSLRPDLVIATALTDPGTKAKLKDLGIRVVGFPLAKNFREICEYFLELGKILGNQKEAEEIVSTAQSKVESIKTRFKGLAKKPKVFIQVGARPLFTMTRDYFVNDFIEYAGAINIAADARSGIYSREKVIEQNPDIIIIVTMGIAGKEEMEVWQRYTTLNAVRNNRIYIIDDYKLASPTPLSFVKTLEEIAFMIHPGHMPAPKQR